MVKITNGIDEFEVTRGAFDGIYSRQGFTLVDENKKAVKKEEKPEVKAAEADDESVVNELYDKPISQWSKDEVKKFAAANGIDISGTQNAREAKEIIKKFVEENQ